MEPPDRRVVWHDQCVRWHENLHEDEDKERVAAGEAESREGKTGEADRHQLHGENAEDNHESVEVVPPERYTLPGVHEVVQRQPPTPARRA